MRNWTALVGWAVLVGQAGWAYKVTAPWTRPEPEPDQHGRSEDAEEVDTERGYEHAPGDQDSEWERHVDDAVSMALPLRGQQEWHSVSCPCTMCTAYQSHVIENNWYPPLRVIDGGDDADLA